MGKSNNHTKIKVRLILYGRSVQYMLEHRFVYRIMGMGYDYAKATIYAILQAYIYFTITSHTHPIHHK